MSIQYLSDENGHVIAVQMPIEEWKEIKRMYPDVGVPAYDQRLESIDKHPERILPIEILLSQLDED